MKVGIKESWLHVLIWSIFIAYESIVVGIVFGVFGNPLTYIAHYVVIISYFYLLSILLLPWALRQKGKVFLSVPIMFCAAIAGYVMVNFWVDQLLLSIGSISHVDKIIFNKGYILKELYRCIYFTGFSTAYFFLYNYHREKNKTTALEKMRLEDMIAEEKTQLALSKAQNDFLRAQVNPHFLFNSLNCVYHNIDPDPKLAKEAVIMLSEIMRYAVETSHSEGLITVAQEVSQVNKLIRLNQLRKVKTQFLQVYVEEEARQYLVIPLVILTLTENIFKHGQLSDPDQEAVIAIFTGEGFLHIQSSNKVNPSAVANSTKTGILNIQERLNHAYEGHFSFTYGTNPNGIFNASVAISLEALNKQI